jgi:hypothetical protein
VRVAEYTWPNSIATLRANANPTTTGSSTSATARERSAAAAATKKPIGTNSVTFATKSLFDAYISGTQRTRANRSSASCTVSGWRSSGTRLP